MKQIFLFIFVLLSTGLFAQSANVKFNKLGQSKTLSFSFDIDSLKSTNLDYTDFIKGDTTTYSVRVISNTYSKPSPNGDQLIHSVFNFTLEVDEVSKDQLNSFKQSIIDKLNSEILVKEKERQSKIKERDKIKN